MEAAGQPPARTARRSARLPAWLLGLVPLVLIAVALGAFAALDGPGLDERSGPPVEELAVERTVLTPGTIELTVRNDGPDAVPIAQAQVNDSLRRSSRRRATRSSRCDAPRSRSR